MRNNKKFTNYEKAVEAFENQLLNISKALHTWKILAFICLEIAFLALSGNIYLSIRSTLITYVIEVDEAANAKAINPAYQKNYEPKEEFLIYSLKEFVRNFRWISLALVVQNSLLQNIYTFIAIVIFGVILNRIKIAHLSKIIPAFVPLLFIPHFYKELKKRNINFKESIKFIVFVYTFLIILLLDINFFGMSIINFFPKYINNFLYYSMFFSIWSLSMYKERKISQRKFIFYILTAYFF